MSENKPYVDETGCLIVFDIKNYCFAGGKLPPAEQASPRRWMLLFLAPQSAAHAADTTSLAQVSSEL